jgi:lysozyme family protein
VAQQDGTVTGLADGITGSGASNVITINIPVPADQKKITVTAKQSDNASKSEVLTMNLALQNLDKFDKAFQLTMTEEIGGWFNSTDPETIAGGDTTTHTATTTQQKKKCGWVNHPKDPGGLTKYGVAQQSHKSLDVNKCTLDQAKSIYKKNYWDKNLCDRLGNKACAVWFDATVQHGGCRKIFAKAVGMPEGSSMSAMMDKAVAMSESAFMDAFTTARLNYVSGLQVAKDMPGVTARPKRVRGKADAL